MFKDLSKVIIVSDLDGTLLPSNKILSDVDLNAIQRFKNAGGKFTVATGRTRQSTQRYLDIIKPDAPVILYNGGLIFDTVEDRIVYMAQLPSHARNIMQEVYDNFADAAGEILTFDEIFITRDNEFEQQHTNICKINPTYIDLDKVSDGKWIKILFAMDENRLDKLVEFIDNKKYENVDFVRSSETYYEMLPKGTSKGKALERYRNVCEFEDYTIVAVGDYFNDIEMLKYADLGVTPANAPDIVKESADLILDRTSDEGAIASIIDYIFECSAKVNVG